MVILSILLAIVAISNAHSFNWPSGWQELTITYSTGPSIGTGATQNAFQSVPSDLSQQANMNWVPDPYDDGCTPSSGRNFVGRPYIDGSITDDSAAVVLRFLYTANNFVSGVQILVNASQFAPSTGPDFASGFGAKYWTPLQRNNASYYALTAYFLYPSPQMIVDGVLVNATGGADICNLYKGQYASDYHELGIGTGLWLQTTGQYVTLNTSDMSTFNADSLQYIPYERADADQDPNWVAGQCIYGQGLNYLYMDSDKYTNGSNITAPDWVPYVALYNGGRLNALSFLSNQGLATNANPHMEQPSLTLLENQFGAQNVPDFFYQSTSELSALHIYFSVNPQANANC